MDEGKKKTELERLLQLRRIEIIERPTDSAFVCVHSSESARDGFYCFSYLLPLDHKDDFLSQVAWDLRNDDFRPRVQWEERTIDGKRERKVGGGKDSGQKSRRRLNSCQCNL